MAAVYSIYLRAMSGNRTDKVSNMLQKELAEIYLQKGKEWLPGKLISVSKVRVSPDLGIAKTYLSIFPSDNAKENLEILKQHLVPVRKKLGNKLRHSLRVIPEIAIYLDDSLDYQDNIERLLRGEGENPIK